MQPKCGMSQHPSVQECDKAARRRALQLNKKAGRQQKGVDSQVISKAPPEKGPNNHVRLGPKVLCSAQSRPATKMLESACQVTGSWKQSLQPDEKAGLQQKHVDSQVTDQLAGLLQFHVACQVWGLGGPVV